MVLGFTVSFLIDARERSDSLLWAYCFPDLGRARATLEWMAVSKRSVLRAKSSKNEQDPRLPQAEDEFDLTY
jgi:hypothetical protein